MPADERAKMEGALRAHWRVENGELVSDGKEPYLATKRDKMGHKLPATN